MSCTLASTLPIPKPNHPNPFSLQNLPTTFHRNPYSRNLSNYPFHKRQPTFHSLQKNQEHGETFTTKLQTLNKLDIEQNTKEEEYEEEGKAFIEFIKAWKEGTQPEAVMPMRNAISKCSGHKQGTQIHALAIKSHLCLHKYVDIGTSLIAMHARHGTIHETHKVFSEILYPDTFSWTSIIHAYVQRRHVYEAVRLFKEMLLYPRRPNKFTFSILLKGIFTESTQQLFALGRCLHAMVIKSGLGNEVGVGTAIVSMYSKHGHDGSDVLRAFQEVCDKNPKTWNALIVGLNNLDEALLAMRKMLNYGIYPNFFTLSSVLKKCHKNLRAGEAIHALVIKLGFFSSIATGVITMYGDCGETSYAYMAFNEVMDNGNVYSPEPWSAIVSALVKNMKFEETLQVFEKMIARGITVSEFSFTSVVSACAELGYLGLGKEIHGMVLKCGYDGVSFVGNAVLTMYARCADIEAARQVFMEMRDRDLVSWNAMLSAYSLHDLGIEALELYEAMRKDGFSPDGFTFTTVLSACANSGLLEEGERVFESMRKEYHMEASIEHYSCMIDLYGRSGWLDKAHKLLTDMPLKPDGQAWRALLSACRIHGDLEIGEQAALRILDLEETNVSTYIFLSKIYSESKRWDCLQWVQNLMQERGLKVEMGYSRIEVGSFIHCFHSHDQAHPMVSQVYEKLNEIKKAVTEIGFSPNSDSSLLDDDAHGHEKKDPDMFWSHSEMLATAFGILSNGHGSPIRIYSNVRICRSCHNVLKLVSKICNRKVIVKDTNKFHHFCQGLCSCGDYW